MKKTYIIPEILIADCEDAIMVSVSPTSAKLQNNGRGVTYTVDNETEYYESDGY